MSHGLDEDQLQQIVRRTPAGRLGEPDDIARVVQFLTDAGNDYLTGQVIVVDGGLTGMTAPARSPQQRAARFVPGAIVGWLDRLVFGLRRAWVHLVHRIFSMLGFNIVRYADYYSTLPVVDELARDERRWNRPSSLAGLDVDVAAMTTWLGELADRWEDDFRATAGDYAANQQQGFGPGYPPFDARTLYYLLRELTPRRYLEVGSGLSTYYATLAARRNAEAGRPLSITCVEPYPFPALGRCPTSS